MKVVTSFHIDVEKKAFLYKLSKKSNQSMSWLINKAVEDYIDRFNKGEIKLEFRPPNPDIQKFIDELPDMVL